MSNDVYQHRHFFEEDPFPSICLERAENGDCLMSAQFIIFNLGEVHEPNVVELFCDKVKDKKNDKAIRPAGR